MMGGRPIDPCIGAHPLAAAAPTSKAAKWETRFETRYKDFGLEFAVATFRHKTSPRATAVGSDKVSLQNVIPIQNIRDAPVIVGIQLSAVPAFVLRGRMNLLPTRLLLNAGRRSSHVVDPYLVTSDRGGK